MRKTQGVFGDPAIVSERGHLLYVLAARRTQNKPLGLEDGGTALAESG
jgi:hypothetical protein